jgi:hypothetical protein
MFIALAMLFDMVSGFACTSTAENVKGYIDDRSMDQKMGNGNI